MNIYISPHFDDAIGSCGCKIYQDHLNGKEALVLTVFAKEIKEGFSSFARELHELWGVKSPVTERRRENIQACKVLNTDIRNLNFTEAIYRKKDGRYLYEFSDSLFKGLHQSDKKLEKRILLKLKQYISSEDVCYFPSGRGGHVDHILVNNVGKRLAYENYKIVYYRDFYYQGEVYDGNRYATKNKFFNKKCLEKKIEAMKQYKSQIDILFGDNTIEKYYKLEYQNGEVYYEEK